MRKKHVVLPMSLCMAVSLSLGMPARALAGSPIFSRTEEEWARLQDDVLEYEEIADLVHEYNTTVLNNEHQYWRDSRRTTDDFAAKYISEAADIMDGAAMAQTDLERIQAQASARSVMQQAQDSVDDKTTLKLQHELDEIVIVKQAQTAMNNYFQLQQQLVSLEKNRELSEAMVASAQGRQSQGMATYADVLDAQQNLQSADAQIIAKRSEVESARENLIVMLGWAQGATPEIRPIPEVNMEKISAMNLETDTQRALGADYTLKMDERRINNAIIDTNREIYKEKVEDDKQKIAVAVNDGYQKVMQAKSSYDEAVLNLDVATKNCNAASTKYQIGSISRIEYLQAEVSMVSAQTDKEVKNLQLFQAMEDYDWILKGVRS